MPAFAFLKNTSGMFAHTGLNATVHSRQEHWRNRMESFYIKCRALSARTVTGEEEEAMEVEEGRGRGGAADAVISRLGTELYDKSPSRRGGCTFKTISCLLTGV